MTDLIEAIRKLRLLAVTVGLSPEGEALMRGLAAHHARVTRIALPTAKADDVQLTFPAKLLAFVLGS